MPRRVQDIVPGDRRGIRDIPVDRDRKPAGSEVRAAKKPPETRRKPADDEEREIPIHKPASKFESLDKAAAESKKDAPRRMSMVPPAPRKPKNRRKTWLLLGGGILVVLIVAAFGASTYFSYATFTIAPRVVPVTVNSTYIAQGTAATGVLSYDLVTLKGSASTTVAATDGPAITSKAQGKVTIYNAYSAQPQKLIAGTRLAGDSGLVYRLAGSVTIPGYTQTGSNIIPGTISGTIQADQPGATYNISRGDAVSDLKMIAFKGTPKYDNVYARLAGDIAGGFVGHKKTVEPGALASTTAKLKNELTDYLKTKAGASVPEGYITYDTGNVTTFAAPDVGDPGSNSAIVSVSGTFYGILFKKSDLVARVASAQAASSFGSYGYTAPGLESLSFTIANPSDFHPEKKTALIMRLKGDFKLVGAVPIDELKKKLAGLSLADTQAVLKPYYGSVIESGSGELVPSWTKVPTDVSRITIDVEKP